MYQIIKSIINKCDPIRIINISPDDEYDLEINDIIAYIENTKPLTKEGLIQVIDKIFKKWFGYDLYSRDAKALKEVASKILAETQSIKTK